MYFVLVLMFSTYKWADVERFCYCIAVGSVIEKVKIKRLFQYFHLYIVLTKFVQIRFSILLLLGERTRTLNMEKHASHIYMQISLHLHKEHSFWAYTPFFLDVHAITYTGSCIYH